MPAGYSGTPLPKKLGIKPGHRVLLLGAPRGFEQTLGALPEGVAVANASRGTKPFDVIVLFALDERALRAGFEPARARLQSDGGLWIAWPKKSSGLQTDLGDAMVRAHVLASGLVDNKVCALDETWSGLRFVVRLEDRPGAATPRRKA